MYGSDLENLSEDLENSVRDHSFSTFAKLSEKLTFLFPSYAHVWAYQGLRNVSFSENLANVLNE